MKTTKCAEWNSCYESNWRGLITEESYQHPAKYAHGLIKRIVQHLFDEGWVKKSDVVVDPFGGVATGGIVCAYKGLKWVGCELEDKFYKISSEGWQCPGNSKVKSEGGCGFPVCSRCGEQYRQGVRTKSHWVGSNFDLHARKWTNLKLPAPVLLQGDSRKLCEVVREAGCVVSSPPYHESHANPGNDPQPRDGDVRKSPRKHYHEAYGHTPGQLGAMPSDSLDAVLSSPPYATEITGTNDTRESAEKSQKKRKTKGGSLGQSQRAFGYGTSAGNISGLEEGKVDSGLSSPPYEKETVRNAPRKNKSEFANGSKGSQHLQDGYGESEGQLGQETGETFWHAARDIVLHCYQILKPGGVAVWVVKDFVRNKQRVPFCDDWLKLCLACGFTFLHEHHAMLVKSKTRKTLGGDNKVLPKERKSFFRRLAEKKGSPKIDYEVVLCVQKPKG